LNAFNTKAFGCEAYAYNEAGLKVADSICKKLGTVWENRGAQIRTGLYWTRKTNAKAVLIESFFCDNKNDYAKAKKLGFDAHGKLIAEGIHGKSIAAPKTEEKKENTDNTVKYTVQCCAFSVKENAEALKEQLNAAGFAAFVKNV
jgi:N-acetylmuramoyl-L-alanine amidase